MSFSKKMRSRNRKEKKPKQTKKTKIELIKEKLYWLPLDTKILIFKMCIDNHMKEWAKEHAGKLKLTNDFVKSVDYPKVEEDYAEHTLFRPNKRNGFLRQLEVFGHDNTQIQPWLKSNICRPCHAKHVNKGDFLVSSKIEEYMLDKDKVYEDVLDQIDYREYTNLDNKFWVGKNCRCLVCDLIRLQYREQNIKLTTLPMTDRLHKTYAGIVYHPGKKQWNPLTVRQRKQEKDKLRNHKRKQKKKLDRMLAWPYLHRQLIYQMYE